MLNQEVAEGLSGILVLIGFGLAFGTPLLELRKYGRVHIAMPAFGIKESVSGFWKYVIVTIASLLSFMCWLGVVFLSFAIISRECGSSLMCYGTGFIHISYVGWGCLLLGVAYFWMSTNLGDPKKVALTAGVWYHQDELNTAVVAEFHHRGLRCMDVAGNGHVEAIVREHILREHWFTSADFAATTATLREELTQDERLRRPKYQVAAQAMVGFWAATYQQAQQQPQWRRLLTARLQAAKAFTYPQPDSQGR